MSRSAKRVGALVAASALLSGAGTYALFAGTAEAIPGAQEKCAFGLQDDQRGRRLAAARPRCDDRQRRRVPEGRRAARRRHGRRGDAEIRVGYSIDGGAVQEKVYGPGNLANHSEFWETRSTIAVIPLKAGRHKVEPYWRISGGAGTSGAFENGCFTVEGRTK